MVHPWLAEDLADIAKAICRVHFHELLEEPILGTFTDRPLHIDHDTPVKARVAGEESPMPAPLQTEVELVMIRPLVHLHEAAALLFFWPPWLTLESELNHVGVLGKDKLHLPKWHFPEELEVILKVEDELGVFRDHRPGLSDRSVVAELVGHGAGVEDFETVAVGLVEPLRVVGLLGVVDDDAVV